MAGCSANKVPEPADPETARAALRTMLDAWKENTPYDAMRDRHPAIHVADHDWKDGAKLQTYEMKDQGEVLGVSLHCTVTLTLVNPDSTTATRTAVYKIATNPKVSVVRDDNEEEDGQP